MFEELPGGQNEIIETLILSFIEPRAESAIMKFDCFMASGRWMLKFEELWRGATLDVGGVEMKHQKAPERF